jgi:hypothetical protein
MAGGGTERAIGSTVDALVRPSSRVHVEHRTAVIAVA